MTDEERKKVTEALEREIAETATMTKEQAIARLIKYGHLDSEGRSVYVEGCVSNDPLPSDGVGNGSHTTGPWYWCDVENMRTLAPGVLILNDGIGCGGPWGDEIDQRNARLIAAAPELLEALISILYEDSNKSEADRLFDRVKAAAAIAKIAPPSNTGQDT